MRAAVLDAIGDDKPALRDGRTAVEVGPAADPGVLQAAGNCHRGLPGKRRIGVLRRVVTAG
ncbi:hypothetical protein GCM10022222_11310 [Amycolatopsis ultiminotia]|uniref:Uncharacterized protein n=1 Tax=Amycolatopsis ultiminotia TaxID=543629 RepID=A0ABP6V7A2_9PSEU